MILRLYRKRLLLCMFLSPDGPITSATVVYKNKNRKKKKKNRTLRIFRLFASIRVRATNKTKNQLLFFFI